MLSSNQSQLQESLGIFGEKVKSTFPRLRERLKLNIEQILIHYS